MEQLSEIIDNIIDDYKIQLKYFIPQYIEQIKSNLVNEDTPLFTIVISNYTAQLLFPDLTESANVDWLTKVFPNHKKFQELISFNPSAGNIDKNYCGEIFDSPIILNTELMSDTILFIAHNVSGTNVKDHLIYLDEPL
jgi:hypothetical protein